MKLETCNCDYEHHDVNFVGRFDASYDSNRIYSEFILFFYFFLLSRKSILGEYH